MAFGVVIAAAAFALVFNLDTRLQTWLPGWTEVLQRNTEASAAGTKAYARGQNLTARKVEPASAAGLPDYGPAPDFQGIQQWINSKPLTLAGLRGKVVLIDFWTYSCINCLRTLPISRRGGRRTTREGSSSWACTRPNSHSSTTRGMSARRRNASA